MAKTTDPGQKYLARLNLEPANSLSGVEKQLKKVTSQSFANKVVSFMRYRGSAKTDTKDPNDTAFYELKNTNLKASLTLTGAFDGDYIRKVCNWIAEHTELFGGKILEVGCDCGILSCFLAKQLPNSHIVSIDRCQAAISVAKELADKLHVNNVEFVHAGVEDMNDQEFDTVFSSRTMHENYYCESYPDITRLFRYQGAKYSSFLNEYAGNLRSCLKEDGTLISIERSGRNPLWYGWLLALNNNQLVPVPEHIGEIVCKEVEDNHSEFQIAVASVGERQSEEFVFNLLHRTFAKYIKLGAETCQWVSWEASFLLQANLKELVEGFYLYQENGICGKVALWTNRYDDSSLLSEQHTKNDRGLLVSNCYMSSKSQGLSTLYTDVRNFINQGYTAKRFRYDGQEEVIDSEDCSIGELNKIVSNAGLNYSDLAKSSDPTYLQKLNAASTVAP